MVRAVARSESPSRRDRMRIPLPRRRAGPLRSERLNRKVRAGKAAKAAPKRAERVAANRAAKIAAKLAEKLAPKRAEKLAPKRAERVVANRAAKIVAKLAAKIVAKLAARTVANRAAKVGAARIRIFSSKAAEIRATRIRAVAIRTAITTTRISVRNRAARPGERVADGIVVIATATGIDRAAEPTIVRGSSSRSAATRRLPRISRRKA